MENNNNSSFFKELGDFLKPYSFKYIGSVLISILAVVSTISAYALSGLAASELFKETPDYHYIMILCFIAVGLKILNALFLNFSTWISHYAAYYTLRDIRLALSKKMLRLPLGYFMSNGSGRLKAMLVDRIESMEKTLAHMIPELTANILAPLAFLVWMVVIDYRIGLAVIAWIIVGFSVTMGMMKNYNEKYDGQIKCFKEMNQAVTEYVNGIEVIKTFSRSDSKLLGYKDKVYAHAKYNVNWQRETQIYSALGMAIAPFSIFIVLILGLVFYFNSSINGGDLVLLMLLSLAIFNPLMNSMNYFDQLAAMGTNAKEIRDVLDYKELVRGECIEASSTNIEFKNVSFSYDNEKMAIEDISFKLNEGEMLALVGESGSGKSTIAKLLAGYFNQSSGDILIGDKEIKEYKQEYLNTLISYVDQDSYLFNKSILENIRIAKPKATDEEVIEASIKSGCHEFISKLPNGYNTIVGDNGDKLSGGERQRISIVRAMLLNAPIMVLDEATASTDPENEREIEKSLLKVCKNKTLIVVAHRLYTITKADKIAYLSNGRIEMLGSHEYLLDNCPGYLKMYEGGKR